MSAVGPQLICCCPSFSIAFVPDPDPSENLSLKESVMLYEEHIRFYSEEAPLITGTIDFQIRSF